ncbi:hypothetical protein CH373_01785 [Leptospira perolatii]|uniref:Uncharacterized protein n=1 Tax=Leptospira perolatii TaxID=2023191 RepID=A0A2M9ZSX7_9LEPT|nr:hypothetical protein [Leptospira perolatii]PJZ71582.1 hypothetical protein CH360_01785 [Leptospira perolatii]PJZ75198.1 hypothetical protein CH373_01785 [Leptospira perolatii]
MIGVRLRILLGVALLISSLLAWAEPYFPDGYFYQSKLVSIWKSFQNNLLILEKNIRSSDLKDLRAIDSPVPIREIYLWDPVLGGLDKFPKEESLELIEQAWAGKISRYLILETNPVFFVPLQEKQKAVLVILDKSKFHITVNGALEFFYPVPKVGKFTNWKLEPAGEESTDIESEFLKSLKEEQSGFRSVMVGDKSYYAYYSFFGEEKESFIDSIYLVVPVVNSMFFLAPPIFFAVLLGLDLLILLARRKKSSSIESHQREIFRLTERLRERLESESFKKIQIAKTEPRLAGPKPTEEAELETESKKFPVFQTQVLESQGSKTFFVLPFDLPDDIILTPKFLRDPKPISTKIESKKGAVRILPEAIQKKREAIFSEELSKLVEKVKSTTAEGLPAKSKAGESGLLAKALKATGLVEGRLEAAKELHPQQESRFFLWARAWWGIRKSDPNEDLPLSEKFKSWLDNQPIRERRKILEALDEIQRGLDSPSASLLKYYRTILSSVSLKAFSIHFYDRRKGAYHPVVTYGLKEYSKKNMIFLYGDQFLGPEIGETSIIDVTEDRRSDHFFRKKFDLSDLEGVMRIVSFPLFDLGLDFRFFLFFQDPPNTDFVETVRESVEKSIDPVEEAFLQLEIEQASHAIKDKRDMVQIQFLLLRWASHGERSRCHIYRIRIPGRPEFATAESWRKKFLDTLQPSLGSDDYAFGVAPAELLVLSREERKKELTDILEGIGNPFEIIYLPYPENGKNLYTYI